VGIGEQRFADVGEARTAVGAVFLGDAFYPKRTRSHGGALTSGSSRSRCRWRRQIISDRITVGKPSSPRSFTNDHESPFVSFGGHIVGAQSCPRGDCRRFAFSNIRELVWGNTMKLPRRTFLHLAAGAAVLPAVSRTAAAQAYPTRPITIVV